MGASVIVPKEMMDHSHVAIVGSGVAALTALSVWRAEGLSYSGIKIYGTDPDPFHHLRTYAGAIGQDRMRSESSGHLLPTDFPGLALAESIRHGSVAPVARSLFDLYQPKLGNLLAQGASIARETRFADSYVHACVGRVLYRDTPISNWTLYNQAGKDIGQARHVVLALGHAGLRLPPVLRIWKGYPRLAHAYESKQYHPGSTVVVIGAGMAAAHEWIAALRTGCRVIAVSRQPLRRQPLNAPRCDFSAVGLDRYRRLNGEQRHAYLDSLAQGSFPWRPDWEWTFARARSKKQWESRQTRIVTVERNDRGWVLSCEDGTSICADQIIAATGFVADVSAHPLIAQLVQDYGIRVEKGRLLVQDDFIVPGLGSAESRLAVIGNLARWALPTADTFAGMKYTARRVAHSFGLNPEFARRMAHNLRMAFV